MSEKVSKNGFVSVLVSLNTFGLTEEINNFKFSEENQG